MFHIDVVIMVNRALARGGIRSVKGVNEYDLFNDGPATVHTEWPARPDEYAYRKRLDGRLEYIDHVAVFVWGEPWVPAARAD